MADTYKVLGQVVSVEDTSIDAYTVPSGKQSAVSSVLITNTGVGTTDYSLFAVPASEYQSTLVPDPNSYAWTQRGSDIDGEAAGEFSSKVSLSEDGTILAIGASGASGTGLTRVYQRNGSAWVQLGSDIVGEAAGDASGFAISLSADGTVVAISARLNDGNGVNSGHVRVYEWTGSAWVQLGSDIDGEAAGDFSGTSLALSSDGTILAIGATGNDGNGSSSGHVRVYEWTGSAWLQLGSDFDGEAAGDFSGYAISLSADGAILAIGTYSNDGNGSDSGHVRVYEWTGSAWLQLGSDIDGEAEFDRLGVSVSLSSNGTILAVGAFGGSSQFGSVRVYQWSGSAWVQLGSDIDGEATNMNSGESVALSADGTILAVGAPGDSGNGQNSGHVRVHQWNGSAWVQIGSDIDGEAAGDSFGLSLALSADGTILAAGATYNGGNGQNSGHVRVYDYSTQSVIVTPLPKHAIIKSKTIESGEHHEITGGITLSESDALVFKATNDSVVINVYGVETL